MIMLALQTMTLNPLTGNLLLKIILIYCHTCSQTNLKNESEMAGCGGAVAEARAAKPAQL